MSKISIRHGAVIRCDIVHVRETATEIIFENECKSQFVTYSVPAVARKQALTAGWQRTKIRYVTWTGEPPGEPKKKVDVCPDHAACVLTQDEYKRRKKEARAQAKLAKPKLELVKDVG